MDASGKHSPGCWEVSKHRAGTSRLQCRTRNACLACGCIWGPSTPNLGTHQSVRAGPVLRSPHAQCPRSGSGTAHPDGPALAHAVRVPVGGELGGAGACVLLTPRLPSAWTAQPESHRVTSRSRTPKRHHRAGIRQNEETSEQRLSTVPSQGTRTPHELCSPPNTYFLPS